MDIISSFKCISLHTLILLILSRICYLSKASELNPAVAELKSYCNQHKNLPIGFLIHEAVILDFDFICSSIFSDKVPVSPEMSQQVSEIYNISKEYCLNSNIIKQDPDFGLLQKRILIHGKDALYDDNLRSKTLSCLTMEFEVRNTSIQPPFNEKLTSEIASVYTRNTLDFILGYINPADVDILDILSRDFALSELGSKILLSLGFEKIMTFQMGDYLTKEVIVEMWEDRSLTDLIPMYSGMISDNINNVILVLESLISKIGCDDVLTFNYIIKELSYVYLAISFYQNLIDGKQHYKLRFSPLYFPNFDDQNEVLLWLALRGSLSQYQVLYYSSLLDAEDARRTFDIHKIKEIVLKLLDLLRYKYEGYYDLYLKVHMISRTYLSSKSLRISILENYTSSNLCSIS